MLLPPNPSFQRARQKRRAAELQVVGRHYQPSRTSAFGLASVVVLSLVSVVFRSNVARTSATARSVGPGAGQTRAAPAISLATACGLSPLSVPQRPAASSPRLTGGGGDSSHGRQPNARNAALLRPKPSAAARVRIGARTRLHRRAVHRGFAAHHRPPFRSRWGSEWVHSVLPCSYAQPVVAADAPKAARR